MVQGFPDDQRDGVPKLRREIGLIGLTAYVVGMILGAGVYALIGKAASLAGDSLWLAFLLAAVVLPIGLLQIPGHRPNS
ncbi:MAG TPA: hypothetical protein VNG11_02665 [Chloroflexota bacterium]|nr:hypothetical protein [Chloroflexota bacterium]